MIGELVVRDQAALKVLVFVLVVGAVSLMHLGWLWWENWECSKCGKTPRGGCRGHGLDGWEP